MKKKREILFNDISIKEISSIFTKIDEQIFDLHNCSSDDFMGLHTDFKKYYNHSKGISENANEIFNSLSEESNRGLFLELQSLYKDLNRFQGQSQQNLNDTNKNFSSIQSLLEQLFIPIKNLKQNLSTLKFLIASINLSDLDLSAQEEDDWDNTINRNNEIIDEYRDNCLSSENSIFSLDVEIANALNGFETYYRSSCNDLDYLLNNIHYGIIFFAEKHEEVKRQIPELTTKTENNSLNISDIITNLQYQDIIRQKIEHIQLTHNEILSELQGDSDINDSSSSKEIQLFQKIKDIAGLQAAILVSANKEYQLAIEKITRKFLEIGDDLLGITSICMRLNDSQGDSDEVHFTGMLTRLNNSEQILSDFIERSKSYYALVKTVSLPLQKTIAGITNLLDSSRKFSKSTVNIISLFSENAKQDASINANVTRINEVCEDIQLFERVIQDVFNEIGRNEKGLTSHINFYNDTFGENELVSNSARNINSIINQLSEKSIRISSLLENNVKLSTNTVEEIKESIKRIRYYDLFEKSITSIISDLNYIHGKLKGRVFDETKRIENLDSVKSLYTMEKEYEIHERVAMKNEGDSLTGDLNLDEEAKAKDSDEVELF
jgi:hypothetical protein